LDWLWFRRNKLTPKSQWGSAESESASVIPRTATDTQGMVIIRAATAITAVTHITERIMVGRTTPATDITNIISITAATKRTS
jgi:hypothetical protein